jgi:hypothetical protein
MCSNCCVNDLLRKNNAVMNPQNLSAQDPLAQLQDIHLPAAIGIWPPAWGWWILLLLIITSVSLLVFFVIRKKTRNAYRKLALIELEKIQQQFSAEQNAEYLQAISIILRRTALSGFGTQFNASLKGEAWLHWLDAQCAKTNNQFSQGAGRVLLIGPYQKTPEFDRHALQKLAAIWITEHHNQWQTAKNKIVNEVANHA